MEATLTLPCSIFEKHCRIIEAIPLTNDGMLPTRLPFLLSPFLPHSSPLFKYLYHINCNRPFDTVWYHKNDIYVLEAVEDHRKFPGTGKPFLLLPSSFCLLPSAFCLLPSSILVALLFFCYSFPFFILVTNILIGESEGALAVVGNPIFIRGRT